MVDAQEWRRRNTDSTDTAGTHDGNAGGTGKYRLLRFDLSLPPTPQQRPRFSRVTGAYKSKTQKDNEAVLDLALRAHRPLTPFSGPVSLSVVCLMPIPSSLSERKKSAYSGQFCENKPDLDNMLKQVKDSMTRVGFWHDDRQVALVETGKMYSKVPGWRIGLEELPGIEGILVGWKAISGYTIQCREHLIKHGYPVYATEDGGVYAHMDELDDWKKRGETE